MFNKNCFAILGSLGSRRSLFYTISYLLAIFLLPYYIWFAENCFAIPKARYARLGLCTDFLASNRCWISGTDTEEYAFVIFFCRWENLQFQSFRRNQKNRQYLIGTACSFGSPNSGQRQWHCHCHTRISLRDILAIHRKFLQFQSFCRNQKARDARCASLAFWLPQLDSNQ